MQNQVVSELLLKSLKEDFRFQVCHSASLEDVRATAENFSSTLPPVDLADSSRKLSAHDGVFTVILEATNCHPDLQQLSQLQQAFPRLKVHAILITADFAASYSKLDFKVDTIGKPIRMSLVLKFLAEAVKKTPTSTDSVSSSPPERNQFQEIAPVAKKLILIAEGNQVSRELSMVCR